MREGADVMSKWNVITGGLEVVVAILALVIADGAPVAAHQAQQLPAAAVGSPTSARTSCPCCTNAYSNRFVTVDAWIAGRSREPYYGNRPYSGHTGYLRLLYRS
jgi:hypothetical protein